MERRDFLSATAGMIGAAALGLAADFKKPTHVWLYEIEYGGVRELIIAPTNGISPLSFIRQMYIEQCGKEAWEEMDEDGVTITVCPPNKLVGIRNDDGIVENKYPMQWLNINDYRPCFLASTEC